MDYSQKYLKYKIKYDVFKKLNSTNIYSGGSSKVPNKTQVSSIKLDASSSLFTCNETLRSLNIKVQDLELQVVNLTKALEIAVLRDVLIKNNFGESPNQSQITKLTREREQINNQLLQLDLKNQSFRGIGYVQTRASYITQLSELDKQLLKLRT
jgi:hypothetical protein